MDISEYYQDVIGEDRNYEFKAFLNSENPVKWAKTIVGYANSFEGGTIFVGVSDDGEAFGLDRETIDRTKSLVYLVNDRHIFPHARISFSMKKVDEEKDRYVLALRTFPSESLVKYREGDFDEKVYIRRDGSTSPASAEDIISLSGKKHGVDNELTNEKYDEERWSDYLSLCRSYRRDNTIPKLNELQSMELVSVQGYVRSGFLMFMDGYAGDETLICCRLWDGEDKLGFVVDRDSFKGSLSRVFSSSLSFIERNTRKGWRKTEDGGREEIRAYPKTAVREALVNAVAHRDYTIYGTQIDVDIYTNRIEIMSPGSWMLPLPFESYEADSVPSIRRNTIIAAALDTANLMERSGTGIQTIMSIYSSSPSSRQPCLLLYPDMINIRLYALSPEASAVEDKTPLRGSATSRAVVLSLLRSGPKGTRELQTAVHYNDRNRFLKDVIDPLIREGVVVREGNIKSPKSVLRLV